MQIELPVVFGERSGLHLNCGSRQHVHTSKRRHIHAEYRGAAVTSVDRWTYGLFCSIASICLAAVNSANGWGEIATYTEEAVQRGLVYEIQSWGGPTSQFQGFGVAIVDLNNNGHQDIIVMGNGTGQVGFFENDGSGHFTDRSFITNDDGEPVPKLVLPKASGIAVADYNGNGMLDVYITQQGAQPNVLLRNDGDFAFTNVASEAGVDNAGHGEGAAWGDFDNDGWVDLYLVNYTFLALQNEPEHQNHLYRNLGDGTFENVAPEQTVDDNGVGFTAVFSDMNRNGWLDLYVANDRGAQPPLFHPNQSWTNNQGQYENSCDDSGLCLGLWSMCIGAGDVTGNGYVDFYVTNLPNKSGYNGWNPLFINQGDGTFSEECVGAGVCQFIFSWAGIFFDFNNNGWNDLYVCNQAEDNNLFANDGSLPLDTVTQKAGVAGSPGYSFNAAIGDVTGNGALDILLNDYGSDDKPRNVQLLINHEGEKRNWVRFNVVGYDGNVHAIGANIEVTADGHTQWREIYAGGNNFKAQNELVFHFGLAAAEQLDEIVVNWPGGQATRTLSSYPVNTTWTIYPPEMLGDFNGDGVIGVLDLLALLSAWGQVTPGVEMMDMNGDGVIDVSDLMALLSAWGESQ